MFLWLILLTSVVPTSLRNCSSHSRFVPDRGFKGADSSRQREGPVQFEKDEDLFGLNKFMEMAKQVKHLNLYYYNVIRNSFKRIESLFFFSLRFLLSSALRYSLSFSEKNGAVFALFRFPLCSHCARFQITLIIHQLLLVLIYVTLMSAKLWFVWRKIPVLTRL